MNEYKKERKIMFLFGTDFNRWGWGGAAELVCASDFTRGSMSVPSGWLPTFRRGNCTRTRTLLC